MIAGRLRECLRTLRWEAADLALELDCPGNDVARWVEGRAPVPLAVAAWIEALAKAHRAMPPPRLSQQNLATPTIPAGPVVVQAFTGVGPPQPHGIVPATALPAPACACRVGRPSRWRHGRVSKRSIGP